MFVLSVSAQHMTAQLEPHHFTGRVAEAMQEPNCCQHVCMAFAFCHQQLQHVQQSGHLSFLLQSCCDTGFGKSMTRLEAVRHVGVNCGAFNTMYIYGCVQTANAFQPRNVLACCCFIPIDLSVILCILLLLQQQQHVMMALCLPAVW